MLIHICNRFAPCPRKVLRGLSPLPSTARPPRAGGRKSASRKGLFCITRPPCPPAPRRPPAGHLPPFGQAFAAGGFGGSGQQAGKPSPQAASAARGWRPPARTHPPPVAFLVQFCHLRTLTDKKKT